MSKKQDGIEVHVIIKSQSKSGEAKVRTVRRFIPIHETDTHRAIVISEKIDGRTATIHAL